MRIDIIGAGSVGATLGRAWIKHGEDVIWGLRILQEDGHAARGAL
jgi:predicted dinucleotide-binding enzyme